MVIKIFDNGGKTADRYTVFIQNIFEKSKNGGYDYCAFFMSSDAHSPNGVNMSAYMIDYDEFISDYDNRKTEIFCGDEIPFAVMLAISNRIAQMFENSECWKKGQ